MFIALETFVNGIDIETVAPAFVPIVQTLQAFFASGYIIFFAILIRNLFGYLRNYWKTNFEESYDMKRLYSLFTYYIGMLGTVKALAQLLPSPWGDIAVGFIGIASFVLDFALSELKK